MAVLLLACWLAVAAYMLYDRWDAIRIFALGDTDDNMRMMQVRAWLSGQGWYDLRQYRLNPPGGFSIHWSRLMPITPQCEPSGTLSAIARRLPGVGGTPPTTPMTKSTCSGGCSTRGCPWWCCRCG